MYQPICLSIHLFIHLSIYLCIHVSICVSIHHQHSLCLAFSFAYVDNVNHNRCLSDSSCYTSYCMLSLIGAAVEGISLPTGTRTFTSSPFSTFCTSIPFFLYLLHLYPPFCFLFGILFPIYLSLIYYLN